MAMEEASPLILLGNISEISTQVTGASEVAYMAMASSTKKETNFTSAWLRSNNASTMYTSESPSDPMSISGLLPSLSTCHMATRVKTRFTIPMEMVSNSWLFRSAPTDANMVEV